jgi:hypothetical protein
MSFGRQTTARLVKPLKGAITRKATLGATTEAGELVTLQSDGYWDPSNTTSAAQLTVAVAVQGGSSGDQVDIVTHGPVTALIDATPGELIYATNTAGEPGESAGSKSTIAGYAESATVLYVQPQIVDLT